MFIAATPSNATPTITIPSHASTALAIAVSVPVAIVVIVGVVVFATYFWCVSSVAWGLADIGTVVNGVYAVQNNSVMVHIYMFEIKHSSYHVTLATSVYFASQIQVF